MGKKKKNKKSITVKATLANPIFYNGIEYDLNSIEFKNLLLIDGTKKENQDTVLGLMADALKEDFKKDNTN